MISHALTLDPAALLDLALQLDFYSNMENHDWLKAWLVLWSHNIARAGLFLIIGGSFTVGLWTWSESITPPATFLTLTAGITLANFPGPAARLGYALVAFVLTIGLYTIARRRL